jgi:hypothetical protein
MPRVGFEPTTPMFEWAKTIHALDRAITVLGRLNDTVSQKNIIYRNLKLKIKAQNQNTLTGCAHYKHMPEFHIHLKSRFKI